MTSGRVKSRRRGRIRPLLRHFVGFCTTDESNRIDTLAHAVTAPCTNMDSKNIRDGVCKRLLSFGRCALNRSREKNPLDSDDFLIGASTLEYNAILYSSLLCARKSSYQKNGSLSKARLDIGRGTGKTYLPVLLLLLLFRKSGIVNIDSNSYNEKAGREMDHTRNRRRKGCGTAAEMQLS